MVEYEKFDVGVPHCQFEVTTTGFKLQYSKGSFGLRIGILIFCMCALSFSSALIGSVWSKVFGDGTGMIIGFGIFGFSITWAAVYIFSKVTIEVTHDAVIINGKHYFLDAFGVFNDATGYIRFHYGNKFSHWIPGCGDTTKNFEFVTSLNQWLHAVRRRAVAKYQPSAEQLREAARSNEF